MVRNGCQRACALLRVRHLSNNLDTLPKELGNLGRKHDGRLMLAS
jgi:hypothetical protein